MNQWSEPLTQLTGAVFRGTVKCSTILSHALLETTFMPEYNDTECTLFMYVSYVCESQQNVS